MANEATRSALPRLLTPKEVADALQISLTSAYRLINEGRLPVVRIGPRLVRVSAEALGRWIDRQDVPA